jgi:hypothetical protein
MCVHTARARAARSVTSTLFVLVLVLFAVNFHGCVQPARSVDWRNQDSERLGHRRCAKSLESKKPMDLNS